MNTPKLKLTQTTNKSLGLCRTWFYRPLSFAVPIAVLATMTSLYTIATLAMDTQLVSVESTGANSGDDLSVDASVTADGRFVTFASNASNLVSNDGNGLADVFVRDLLENTTTLISVNSAGNDSGDSTSFGPAISADGAFIAFQSDASDLVDGDVNGVSDVFVRNLQTNETTLVSVSNSGSVAGDNSSVLASISGDGRFVAFTSDASNLVSNDSNGLADVFVRDLQENTTTLVSADSSGNASGDGDSMAASISDDGQFIAFQSVATNLTSNDTNGTSDVFLRDLSNGTTILVSVNVSGNASGNDASMSAAISADGGSVAFSSLATDLVSVALDTNGAFDVFIRDVQSGTTSLVSIDQAGAESGDAVSSFPSLSGDGQLVAFTSFSSNLVTNDTNASDDVFVRDLQTNTTLLASVNSVGTDSGNSFSGFAALSDDGRSVAFESDASDLVAVDDNGLTDVFIRSLLLDSGPLVAATLPSSRSVQVSQPATAFAAIINASTTQTALSCGIAPSTTVPADFVFQTTDVANQATGDADSPVDIGPGATQNFVISFTPTAAFNPTSVSFTYDCANTDPAASIEGLNTLLLSADTNPVADVVGLTTTVDLFATEGVTALFAVGSANVGATSTITVSVDDNGANLPASLSICQTGSDGACLAEPDSEVVLNYPGASTASFAVFVEATDTIANDPANNRLFIRFNEADGTARGATSTSVRTQ